MLLTIYAETYINKTRLIIPSQETFVILVKKINLPTALLNCTTGQNGILKQHFCLISKI